MVWTENQTILQKADLAIAELTAGGGILKPAQAQKFMRLLIKDAPLMRLSTVVPMASPKQEIGAIRFGSRVLHPGQEATALAESERARPDLSKVELDAKLFKGEIRLSDEVLEDNIERGELRQTLMELLAEAVRRDMEEIIINGDTASPDPFLARMDGLLKQAQSNVVDAGNAPLTKEVLRDLLKTLPSEHLRDKKQMRFLTSIDAEIDYRNTLSERATVVGDRVLEGDAPVMFSGVPLQAIPMFPEALGDKKDQTAALLCNPKNIHVGIWRNIRIETDRNISEGTMRIVVTLRFDVKFMDEVGVAKAINIKI